VTSTTGDASAAIDLAGVDQGSVDLGRVDQVLVVATLRRIHDPEASEAFVVAVEVAPGERLDEAGLLRELGAAPSALGPQALWSIGVTRTHAGVGSQVSESRAEIRLDVILPTTQSDTGVEVVESLWARLGGLVPTSPRGLTRDESIDRALEVVAMVWGVAGDHLRVSDEQHHPDRDGWTIGLVDEEGTRFEVELGTAGGGPRSIRVRRHRATEVADSIGESG